MLVNGTPQQTISLNERALAYGDGVFETIRLFEGQPVLLAEHLQRLSLACDALDINCDFKKLNTDIQFISEEFDKFGVLKIVLSRGEGGRGYRPDTELEATRILTLHSLPVLGDFDANNGIAVFMCRQRLSQQKALAGIKHLAAKEWPNERFFEGLMCDVDGDVIEGTRTNLFFSENGSLRTPALTYAGVNGVLRQLLLEKMPKETIIEDKITVERLLQADELFLCNSVIGVWPVKELVITGLVTDKSQYFTPGKFSEIAKELFRETLF